MIQLPDRWRDIPATPVSGGMIAQAVRLELADGPAFLKYKDDADDGAFAAEAEGLGALESASPGSTPRVVDVGDTWLLLDWMEPAGHAAGTAHERELARIMAQVHTTSSEQGYGYEMTTWLGRLIQDNTWTDSWVEMFANRRVRPQVERARANGLLSADDAQTVMEAATTVARACPDEPSSLVHGDLWSGNWMVTRDHGVVIIDPAVHFAHREFDLAFLNLWGGVGQSFWDEYNQHLPLADGYRERLPGLALYHLVVHINHFGSQYVAPTMAAARSVAIR